MSPPHFPITPSELEGRWRFVDLDPGTIEIDGFTVTAVEVPHKGGRTFGYRIDDGAVDAGLPARPRSIRASAPASTVSASCTRRRWRWPTASTSSSTTPSTPARSWPRWAHFGHSAAEYAVSLGLKAGAQRVLLFHHGPAREDDEIDRLVDRVAVDGIVVAAAVEGTEIDLP